MSVHLLSVEKFRDFCPVTEDVDAVLAKKVLFLAQDTHIHSLLGTKLYKHILAIVVSGDISLPANSAYKTLLDEYIIPSLQCNGYYRFISHISSQITDKGVMKRRGEFADQADSQELRRLRADAQNDYEFKDNLLITFLCDNSGDYLEYTNTEEGINAKRTPYFSGMYFGPGQDDSCSRGLDKPC